MPTCSCVARPPIASSSCTSACCWPACCCCRSCRRLRWQPTGAESPSLQILLLLIPTIGLPYFLLATTSPLLQAWLAEQFPGKNPYRLFALSNLASLGALLSTRGR